EELCEAQYEIVTGSGAAKCVIDFENAFDVVRRTSYDPEIDEAEHIASMEALRAHNLYREIVPAYERFISKKTRDAMPESDFAGKGKSFPIKTQQDLDAAVSSIGRAGPG